MEKKIVIVHDQDVTVKPPTEADLKAAIIELQLAEQDMNMAVEPDFIDAAIYKYSASLSKYQALIKLLKESGTDDKKAI